MPETVRSGGRCSPIYFFCEKSGRTAPQSRINSAATVGGAHTQENMKRITLSIVCLSSLALSAFAQENATPAADNTGRNERDRSGETQTSGDQSNGSPDIKMTAAIRRAVMHDDSLSMMAKNVKIITENGMVTLRGPVKSEAEKTKIAQLAKQAAQGAMIHNELEVKASEQVPNQ
jgi:osmotically-inducible protein OsmY